MRDIIITELTQALQELVRAFAHSLPRLVVTLIIAFIGWVIASLLKVLVRSILRLTRFSKLSENSGATHLLNQAALPSSTELLSRFVFWVAWVGFILLGVSVLGIVGLQEYISRFFLFLPRLFVALVILFFGLLAANFFARAALLAAVNANFRSSRLLSISIRIIISIFALSMVFEVLGVAEQTMLIAFGTAFGAVMLGLAIAFGIGGKDLAREFLEKRLVTRKKEEKEDELSPLVDAECPPIGALCALRPELAAEGAVIVSSGTGGCRALLGLDGRRRPSPHSCPSPHSSLYLQRGAEKRMPSRIFRATGWPSICAGWNSQWLRAASSGPTSASSEFCGIETCSSLPEVFRIAEAAITLCAYLRRSFISSVMLFLSRACLINIGLNLLQHIRMQAPHLMHCVVLTFSKTLPLGSFGSLPPSTGLSRPILSSFGTVKFMMINATKEAPKNCV